MKGKTKWSWRNLGFPAVFFLCFIFFVVGFLGCMLLSQEDISGSGPRSMLLESVEPEFKPMPHGETGESSIVSIPFQVLSWKPRALYFPKFATADQCEHIIKMAKANLVPSSLALRKGETAENTKGVRTSSGTFISASEDKSGILGIIEQKMARVTMIPRAHGEVEVVLHLVEPMPIEDAGCRCHYPEWIDFKEFKSIQNTAEQSWIDINSSGFHYKYGLAPSFLTFRSSYSIF